MKNILLICGLLLSFFSCGSESETELKQSEKFYVEFVESGKILDDSKCSFAAGHNKITFSIGKKAKIMVMDLHTELKENDIASRVGKSYPAELTYDDKAITGTFQIDAVKKDEGNDKYGQIFIVSGTFNSVDGEKVKYAVSVYNMND